MVVTEQFTKQTKSWYTGGKLIELSLQDNSIMGSDEATFIQANAFCQVKEAPAMEARIVEKPDFTGQILK